MPLGVSARPYGSVPTGMSPTGIGTTPFARSVGMTLKVPLTVFATYALLPSGRKATPFGSSWTATSARRRPAPGRTSKNDTVSLSGLATARKSPLAVSASGCEEVGPAKRQRSSAGGTPPVSSAPPSSALTDVFLPVRPASSRVLILSVAVSSSFRVRSSFVRSRRAGEGATPPLAASRVMNARYVSSEASSRVSLRWVPFLPFGVTLPVTE